jgi:hypothetical protein
MVPLMASITPRKRVVFYDEDDIVYANKEDNPANQHFFYRALNLGKVAVPTMFWNAFCQSPLLMSLYCLGHLKIQSSFVEESGFKHVAHAPSYEIVLSGIFMGRMISEFWCVNPIRGINLLFEYETRWVLNQRRSETHVSFYLNENRILLLPCLGFFFLLVFMNINLYQQQSIDIEFSRDIGKEAIKWALVALFGIAIGGMADIERRFLKTFGHRRAIQGCMVVRVLAYPFWLKAFVYDMDLKSVGFALVYTIDNTLAYIFFFCYVNSTSLSKHMLPLNLDYFERTGVKIDQARAAVYSVSQKMIS